MKQGTQALLLASKLGILKAEDARRQGISGSVLSRLVAKGELLRLSRGLYMLPETEITEHHDLAEVGRRTPSGVICLLSALRFHDLTTQAPHEVWLMIKAHSRRPREKEISLRIFEASGDAFRHGIEEQQIEGGTVQVTSAAKTVADCFRFRSSVGLDVAIEALQAYIRERAGTLDALYTAATACHVRALMQPYIEASV